MKGRDLMLFQYFILAPIRFWLHVFLTVSGYRMAQSTIRKMKNASDRGYGFMRTFG